MDEQDMQDEDENLTFPLLSCPSCPSPRMNTNGHGSERAEIELNYLCPSVFICGDFFNSILLLASEIRNNFPRSADNAPIQSYYPHGRFGTIIADRRVDHRVDRRRGLGSGANGIRRFAGRHSIPKPACSDLLPDCHLHRTVARTDRRHVDMAVAEQEVISLIFHQRPTAVRVILFDVPGDAGRVGAQVLLVHPSLLVHDKRHDPR